MGMQGLVALGLDVCKKMANRLTHLKRTADALEQYAVC